MSNQMEVDQSATAAIATAAATTTATAAAAATEAPKPAASQLDSKHVPTPTGDAPVPIASASGGAKASVKETKSSAATAPARDSDEWRLSISLNKFDSAVRDIAVGSNNSLVVAEERGRVSVWARQGRSKDFYNKDLFFDKMHEGLAFCVEPIFPKGQYHAPIKPKPKTAAAAVVVEPVAAASTAAMSDAAPAAAAGAPAAADGKKSDGSGSSILKVTRAAEDVAADAGPLTEFFVTGGGGLNLAKTITSYGKLVNTMGGHTGPVNCVSQTADGKVLTGSWDGTVKIWQNGSQVGKLDKNQQYATEVLGLPSGEIITGSGNKAINIYRADGTLIKSIAGAHEHVIRKLAYHPLGFVSAGNDGHVKLWTLTGEVIADMPTHAHTDMKEKFIYGMCVLSTGEFVAAGDDGTVKIWSGDGQKEIQVIPHPGSVRCVKALPNGDFATGCADKVLRVFTKNSDRLASDLELKQFDELMALIATAGGGGGMKGFDNSTLPDESALQVPGKKDGAIKVVMTKLKGPYVFKWSAAESKWEEVGEALGQKAGANMPRPKVGGQEYDFVTDVFVTDDRSVQLGFNRDDDPDEIANNFCTAYGLPPDYREQILQHIRPKIDMNLVSARRAAERAAKLAKQYKQIPCWTIGGFQMYSGNIKLDAMKQRFLQHNSELTAAGTTPAAVLSPAELKTLDAFVTNVCDEANYHVAQFPPEQHALLTKMLGTWPADKLIPVLDAYRCLMVHETACDKLGTDAKVRALHFAAASPAHPKNSLLVLRALANWIAKRKKPEMSGVGRGVAAAAARAAQPAGIPKPLSDFILEALMKFATSSSGAAAAGGSGDWKDKHVTEAYVLFVHNVVAWLGRLGTTGDSEFWLVIASSLVDILSISGDAGGAAAQSQKITFFALVTLASMAWISPPAKAAIKSAYGEKLVGFAKAGLASPNVSIKQVADDLTRVFGLSL